MDRTIPAIDHMIPDAFNESFGEAFLLSVPADITADEPFLQVAADVGNIVGKHDVSSPLDADDAFIGIRITKTFMMTTPAQLLRNL